MRTYQEIKKIIQIQEAKSFDTVKRNIIDIFKSFSNKMTKDQVDNQFFNPKFGLHKTLGISRQDVIDVFDSLVEKGNIIKKNNIFIYKK